MTISHRLHTPIERIRVYTMEPDRPKASWSPTMPELLTTNTVVRITTEDGLEGAGAVFSCTERDADRAVAEAMRPLINGLVGRMGLRREEIWSWMNLRRLSVSVTAVAGIDTALWDLAARRMEIPLYAMLGGARDRIPAYASTQVLSCPEAYLDEVAAYREMGFGAVKFHYRCEPEEDLKMMRAVHKEFGGDMHFMFDADGYYSHKGALRVARQMEEMGFGWLEAPFPDNDLDGYRELRHHTALPILPDGNTIVDLRQIANALRHGCWDGVHIDVNTAAGITPSRKVLSLAEANGMNVEFQSWGSALSMAANLHLMLSVNNSSYFELAMPWNEFQNPALGTLTIDDEGYINAPDGAGLGIDVDWEAVEDQSVFMLDTWENKRTCAACKQRKEAVS